MDKPSPSPGNQLTQRIGPSPSQGLVDIRRRLEKSSAPCFRRGRGRGGGRMQAIVTPLIQLFTLARRIRHRIPGSGLVFAVGLLALLASARKDWYHLPPTDLQQLRLSLAWIQVVHVITLTGLLMVLAPGLWRGLTGVSRRAVWGLLAVTLMFPYLVNTWLPDIAFMASAYYEQDQAVVRQVESKLPDVQAQWKQHIALAPSRPQPSRFGMTVGDRSFFQLASWDQLWLEGLGYRNSFFAFIGKGWTTTVLGLVICLVALYQHLSSARLTTLTADLAWGLPYATGGLALVLGLVLGINVANYQLDTAFALGNYPQVIATSQRLQTVYPALKFDTAFQERTTRAAYYAGQADAGQIAQLRGVEHYRLGQYAKAIPYLQEAFGQQPQSLLLRQTLATALLNAGVNYFETPILPNRPQSLRFPNKSNFIDSPKAREGPSNAKAAGAMPYLNQAIALFPNHIEALYTQMLVSSLNGQDDRAAAAARQLIAIEAYFQQPNTALLGQTYNHLAWSAYREGDMAQTWERYRQSVDPGHWDWQPPDDKTGSDHREDQL